MRNISELYKYILIASDRANLHVSRADISACNEKSDKPSKSHKKSLGYRAIFYMCLSVLVGLVLISTANSQSQLINREVKDVINRLSVDVIKQHLTVLGHDSLEGRGTGCRGGYKAAQYIANQLHSLGLQPLGDNNSYFQNIPLHGSYPRSDCQFRIFGEVTTLTLNLWSDYVLYNTGAQTFIPTPIPLVFVGYGIIAPEYDYNDYRNLDVENQIVVFLSGEPLSYDSTCFDGERRTVYSNSAMKHRIALSRGARGSIMIPLPREKTFSNWNYWASQFMFEDVKLPYGIVDNLNVLFNIESAPYLFENAPFQLEDVFAFDSTGAMRSFPLHVSASFSGKFKERDFVASNVIGMLEGSDPLLKDSYIIICAHYDHLGIGMPVEGDSIYNGVIDNAIGVSVILELARGFVSLTTPPSRSIIFLFVIGEEKGLLGSQYYCDHPIVPLHKTIAAINVDGISIFDLFNSVIGVGAELSTLGDQLETVAAEFGLGVSSIPYIFLEPEPFSCSDQFKFAQAGIPSILVMEGLNYQNISTEEGMKRFVEWGRRIYHTPFDDLHQDINFEAVLQHTQVLFAFVDAVANTYVPPQWVPGSMFINARLQTIAEKR